MSLFDDSAMGKQVVVERGPACGACKLKDSCKSPKIPLQGEGRRGILIVLAGPTRLDDERGRYVERIKAIAPKLAKNGLDVNRDCWVTGATVCYAKGGHETAHAQHCRYTLLETVQSLRPKVCILVGDVACAGLLQADFKHGCDSRAATWAGEVIPSQELNCWIIPTFDTVRWEYPGEGMMADNAIEHAARLCGTRPWSWNQAPDYAESVRTIYDDDEAVAAIEEIEAQGYPIAFDYETNTLRPETEGSKIYSVAFSNGVDTFACPWYNGVATATKNFLIGECPKIAANMKFEYRWSRSKLGIDIKNLVWDTMLSAHHLQCRPGNTGLKFQAYALLGQPEYNSQVDKYFQGKAWELNSIDRLDSEVLLVYNGMDALLELLVACKQTSVVGLDLNFPNLSELLPNVDV